MSRNVDKVRQDFCINLSNLIGFQIEATDKLAKLGETNPVESSKLTKEKILSEERLNYYLRYAKELAKEQNIDLSQNGKFKLSNPGEVLSVLSDPNIEIKFPDEKDFSFEEFDKKADESKFEIRYEKEFNELLNKEENPENIEKLNKIKELLVDQRNTFSSSFASVENPFEKATYHTDKKTYEDFMNENEAQYGNAFDKRFAKTINYRKDVNVGIDFLKNIKDNRSMKLSDKVKENIINVSKKLVEYGIILPDATGEEEKIKEYGFKKILDTKNQLAEFIKKGNIEEAYKKYEEFKDLETKYDELLDMCKESFSQDGFHMPGNLSIARNANAPYKFAERVQEGSQLSSIYLITVFAKVNSIKLEDLLDNPTKVFFEDLKETQENAIAELKDETIPFAKRFAMAMNNDAKTILSKGRTFEGLTVLEENRENRENNAIYTELMTQLSNFTYNTQSNMFMKVVNNEDVFDYELCKKFIAYGDKHDIHAFMPNEINFETLERFPSFDYENEIRSDDRTLDEIFADCSKKLIEGMRYYSEFEDPFVERKDMGRACISAQLFLADVLRDRDIKIEDPEANKIRDFLVNPGATLRKFAEENEMEYVTQIFFYEDNEASNYNDDIKRYKNMINDIQNDVLKAVEKYRDASPRNLTNTYNNIAQNGANLDNLPEVLMIYRQSKVSASHRNFFSRNLTFSGHKEARLIQRIETDLTAKGFSREELEDIINTEEAIEIAHKIHEKGLQMADAMEREMERIEIQREQIEVDIQNNNQKEINVRLDSSSEISNEIEKDESDFENDKQNSL